MPCPNPLTPDQCRILTAAIQYIHDSVEFFRKCESCGIDMSDKLSNAAAQTELAVALRNAFFPNGPGDE